MTGPSNLWHRVKRLADHAPGVLALRRRAYTRAFATQANVNLHHGVFETFEEAERSAPATKPLGYDNDASALMYDHLAEPTIKDYPAIHWLQRAVDAGHDHIFDLGGHVGIKYFAFRQRLQLPTTARWQVCDVPAVVARGTELARKMGVAEQLTFSADWRAMSAASVLFASGSIQYLPTPLGTMLRSLESRPARVVINSAALHPTRSFFTLNSIGVAFCPYRVQSEPSFIAEMRELGYRRLDRWETPKRFAIPFETGYDMDRLVGLAFERDVTSR